jgi:hypothetical protein
MMWGEGGLGGGQILGNVRRDLLKKEMKTDHTKPGERGREFAKV